MSSRQDRLIHRLLGSLDLQTTLFVDYVARGRKDTSD